VYWEDTEDAVRELEETLLNIIDWADMPLRGADVWESDAYFSGQDGEQRQRKLVDCPLPEIEDQQEQAVMNIWGNMTAADRDVTELLLTDGGEISPQEAADQTGNSYRTIRRVVDRCEEIIEHTYGQLSLGSKHQRNLLLERLRAAEDGFKNALEDAVLDAADKANDKIRSRWSKIKRKYNISVKDAPSGEPYQQVLKVRYEAQTKQEADRIINEIRRVYTTIRNRDAFGVCGRIKIAGIGKQDYKNLKANTRGYRLGDETNYDIGGGPQSSRLR
jgi:molybdenum-dependent DNA-binding transcriptional regulator ModE